MRSTETTSRDAAIVGGDSDHDVAMEAISKAIAIPVGSLQEAVAEARSAGRHRVRAVSARRIDEMISELADGRVPPASGGQ